MSEQAIEGVVEEVVPRQIGPGNVPGPLEPRVIDRVEAARQLKKELCERYPGVDFSLRLMRRSRWLSVDYTDGPPREEIEVLADEYKGYWYESYMPGDGGMYHELPGKWVGGQFVRYDIEQIQVARHTSQGVAEARAWWADAHHRSLDEDPGHAVPLGMAAFYLGLGERTVVKLIKEGRISAYKGRWASWRVSMASLKAYKESRDE